MRALTIVFIGLVALPACILGWLGFQYVGSLEGGTRRTIERETDARFESALRRFEEDARDTDRRFRERADASAQELAVRLPDGDDPAGYLHAEGILATRFGGVPYRVRIETAGGEPLWRRTEFPELPEWGEFIEARDAAVRAAIHEGDGAAAAAVLRVRARALRSERLRERLLCVANGLEAADSNPILDDHRELPVVTVPMPHGARLTLLVSRPAGAKDPSRVLLADGARVGESRGLGWRSRVVARVTLANYAFRLRVEHPRGERFVADVKRSKVLTLGAIAALLLLMVVGLWLARRALLRERAARELRDAFIANVSHELKTPLTSVRMYAEMLADSGVEADKRAEYGRVVDAEGARLASLVDDMLDFSALESGARELEVEPIDLAALARAAVEAWRPIAEREGVVLEVDGSREGETALADPAAVGRIVTNLLQNALKHGTPPRDGQTRRIRVRIDGGLSVSDNGPGIATGEQEAIFERFRRGAAAGNKAGAGIGLALARELARAMNGNLMVEDDGTWTRFSLRLPPVPNEPA